MFGSRVVFPDGSTFPVITSVKRRLELGESSADALALVEGRELFYSLFFPSLLSHHYNHSFFPNCKDGCQGSHLLCVLSQSSEVQIRLHIEHFADLDGNGFFSFLTQSFM